MVRHQKPLPAVPVAAGRPLGTGGVAWKRTLERYMRKSFERMSWSLPVVRPRDTKNGREIVPKIIGMTNVAPEGVMPSLGGFL